MSIRVSFSKDWASEGWNVYARHRDVFGRRRIKISIETENTPVAEGFQSEPSAFIPEEEAHEIIKALIEGLAEAGFLGSTSATTSELKATKYHLEDMRTLVLKTKDDNLKP